MTPHQDRRRSGGRQACNGLRVKGNSATRCAEACHLRNRQRRRSGGARFAALRCPAGYPGGEQCFRGLQKPIGHHVHRRLTAAQSVRLAFLVWSR